MRVSVVFQLDLDGDTLRSVPLEAPLSVAPDAPLGEVLDLLAEHQRGSVLVCGEDGRLQGIFTERDAVRLMATGLDPGAPIGTVMSVDPVTVTEETSLTQAVDAMTRGGYRRLPVVDKEGRPTAVLKVTGIVSYLVEYVPDTVYNLPQRPEPHVRERDGA